MSEDVLALWVIYDRPLDFPRHVVVRAQFVNRAGHVRFSPECELFDTIEQAHTAMHDRGLAYLGRMLGDDPKIVGVWL